MYTIDASVWVNGFDRRESGHQISRQLPVSQLGRLAGKKSGSEKGNWLYVEF
jgi:hypothetical protein